MTPSETYNRVAIHDTIKAYRERETTEMYILLFIILLPIMVLAELLKLNK